MSRYTPNTIEWDAALSVELLLLNNPVHYITNNGFTIKARYTDTEIDTELNPVFVFIDLATKRYVSLTLETVCMMASGKPN